MNCAAQPFRWRQQEELEMNPKRSKSRHGRKMPMVHPNAAAIDVGATMHMAAVRADRTPEPVRSFGRGPPQVGFTRLAVLHNASKHSQRVQCGRSRFSICVGICRRRSALRPVRYRELMKDASLNVGSSFVPWGYPADINPASREKLLACLLGCGYSLHRDAPWGRRHQPKSPLSCFIQVGCIPTAFSSNYAFTDCGE